MNIFEKLSLWSYYFLISVISSLIFIFTILVQNFLEIITGSKYTSLIELNMKLVRNISRINFFESFDENFKRKDVESFNKDPVKPFLNFLSDFILIIFLPIFFLTILLFALLKIVYKPDKLESFLQKLILETNKLLLQLIGYPVQKDFYYSNFNIFYFLLSSIPLYFVLSRPAFYGVSILAPFLGPDLGSILGYILGAMLIGIYLLVVFPHFFGSLFGDASLVQYKELIGIKKINLSVIAISLFVIIVFISIMIGVYESNIPSARISYDYPNILLYVSFALIAGVLEEIFFRGIVLNFLLEQSKKNRAVIPIILSALTFAFAHSVNIFYGSSIDQLSFQIYDAFLFGLLIGIIYYKTKSLWPGIIIHTLIDAYSFGFSFTYSGPKITTSIQLIIENIGWTISLISLIVFFSLFSVLASELNRKEKAQEIN